MGILGSQQNQITIVVKLPAFSDQDIAIATATKSGMQGMRPQQKSPSTPANTTTSTI